MEIGTSSRESHPPRRRDGLGRGAPEEDGLWRLPSGEGLVEFALHAGVVTPLLPDDGLEMGAAPAGRKVAESPSRRGRR